MRADPAPGAVVVVVVGGGPPDPKVAALIPPVVAGVIAADSGLDNALALGLAPTLLVGDFDSISPAGLAWAAAAGAVLERHPADKDHSDLELAMRRAVELGEEVLVLDGGGGRADHALVNLAVLASPRWSLRRVTGLVGTSIISVLTPGRRELLGAPGSILTLVPVNGAAAGVTTEGLRWPLVEATLEPGTSWGLSNELLTGRPAVSLRSGMLFAIQPDAL